MKKNNTTLSLPIPKSLIESIDEWRRKQSDLPSRSEAIRRMIKAALEKEGLDG